MKKIVTAALCFASVCMTTMTSFAQDITVFVNGNQVHFPDVKPYTDQADRTLVPIRFIADELNAETSWKESTQTATITKEEKKIDLCLRCKKVFVNEKEVTTDSVGEKKDDKRTMVPLRFLSEQFGATVKWDEKTLTVHVNTNQKNPQDTKESLKKQDKAYFTSLEDAVKKLNQGAEIDVFLFPNSPKEYTLTKKDIPFLLKDKYDKVHLQLDEYDPKMKGLHTRALPKWNINANTGKNGMKIPDFTKMKKIDKSILPPFVKVRDDYLYDGSNWDWGVKLNKESVDPEGFSISFHKSRASAPYILFTDGTWQDDGFPTPEDGVYFGDHVGKEIDKIFFRAGIYSYLVDIDNIKVQK